MNAAAFIAAIDLSAGARVNRRVPKKLLIENGAPTAADKRRINEGIEEIQWLAALKPATAGVPEYRDAVREYLEITILGVRLRAGAQRGRLAELIHRAVPYPVILIASQDDLLSVSMAHKRWSQGEKGATVLDGDMIVADLEEEHGDRFRQAFVDALPIACQPRTNMFALYQGWMDTVLTLLAARLTGAFRRAESPEHFAARRCALNECTRFETQMVGLRAAAAKETQLSRQVELNLELKRVQTEYSAARTKL